MYQDRFYYCFGNNVWIRIPKNGTMTFFHLLDLNQNRERFLTRSEVDWSNKFVFVVVRNPYERVLSCWHNRVKEAKILYTNPELIGLDFELFVEKISKISDDEADHHFRTQSWFIKDIDVDLVLRLENIEDDWEILSKKVGIKKELVHERQTQYGDKIKSFYNKKLVDLVYNRYEEDFELLKYNKDLL